MKSTRHPLGRQAVAWLVVAAFALQPTATLVVANPENPEVRHGDVEFNFDNPGELFIDQFSDKAIIDWESFSIDAGELTRFIQNDSGSIALNRVFTGAPSEIHGQLQANGQLFLINPNGILVGLSGQIDTAGFLASTLDVDDAQFLNGGDMTFSGGSSAAVVNLGTINAVDGGDIFLIAKSVTNEGTLNANEGTVGLAAGSEVRVAAAGDERVTIAPGGEGTVTNKGAINAMTAELKAAGGNQYALAINNEGMVRARSFQRRGGRLYLGANGGRIVNSGQMRASNSVSINNPSGSAEIGGNVRIEYEEVGGVMTIAASNVKILGEAVLDVSGAEAGAVAIAATESAQIDGAVQGSPK
ncbi:MAG: filamentous hemagglutinin N-terminal domain-containing protein [Verrucomicrobiota bacterium]